MMPNLFNIFNYRRNYSLNSPNRVQSQRDYIPVSAPISVPLIRDSQPVFNSDSQIVLRNKNNNTSENTESKPNYYFVHTYNNAIFHIVRFGLNGIGCFPLLAPYTRLLVTAMDSLGPMLSVTASKFMFCFGSRGLAAGNASLPWNWGGPSDDPIKQLNN